MSRFIYYNRVKGGKYLKESRLFKIVYYILENGRITAPELAGKNLKYQCGQSIVI